MCLSCTTEGTGSATRLQPAGWNTVILALSLLPTLPFLAVIYLHRKVLSRFTPPTCRFTPTCSRYGLDAVLRYGALRGGWLASWRVLRCNPFHPGGYDPLS